MTLHEAIIKVLLDANAPLSSGEIADAINNQKLYTRRDGQKLASSQITARVNQYPDLLSANEEGKIQIINRELHSYRITFYHILNLLRNSRIPATEARLIAATTVYISWSRIVVNYQTDNFYKSGFIPHLTAVLKGNDKTNLFDVFLSLLNKLTDVEVFRVFEAMHSPPPTIQKVDTKTFGSFFNEIINEYTSSSDWQVGGYSTPNVVSKFVSSIFKVGHRAKIFDPFVGFGGTLAQAFRFNVEQDPRIVAGDIDDIALSLARLNLLANGCDSTYFYQKNAFSDWQNSIEADLIVSVPPFGLKTHVNELFSTHGNLVMDLGLNNSNVTVDSSVAAIIIALSHLNRHGKAVIVVPDGFLFSTRNDIKNLRQYLVDRRLIAGVVTLPAGSFKPYASVSCSIIILNTATTENKRLFICDASKYNLDAFGGNIDWIARAFRGEVAGTDSARFISHNEVVISNYYDLSPKRYLAFNIAIYGEDYSLLREVTSSISSGLVVSKANINRNSGLPFIQIGDLIDSSGLNEIDVSNVEYFISDKSQLGRRAFIPDRAVLVSKIGTKLKPTLYRYAGDALCNANVLVIKTNEDELLPEYLITQLQSDYVLRQIESVRHNVGVPHASVASFRDIRIKMLPIEEQRRFVASYYGKKLKEEAQSTERKREDDLYNIISTLKHELKQPVSSIGMDIKTVKDFLSKQIEGRALISWSDPVVERLQGQSEEDLVDFQLSKIFARLETCITNAQSTLAKAEEILNIGSNVFTPERVGIKKFIESTLLPVYANECCKINLLGHEQEVTIDKYQIGILFRRLIENAIKHGFKGREDKQKNVINIKLVGRTPDREFLEIVVENNGKPFPEGFDTSKFQTKGLTSNRSSGSGFGGFQIKQIIDNHKGEFSIANKEEIGESEFKVKFKIYLPCQ